MENEKLKKSERTKKCKCDYNCDVGCFQPVMHCQFNYHTGWTDGKVEGAKRVLIINIKPIQ